MRNISSNNILLEILRQEKCANYILELIPHMPYNEKLKSFSDYTPAKKTFSGIEGKHPSETVSKTNKALLRESTIIAAKQTVFQKKLPYIHLAYFPAGYSNVCTFRVDCDKSERSTFFNVVDHASKNDFPMTWFIEVGAQESFLKDIADLRSFGHDVQLHCYQHITYDNYIDNERNIQKGKGLMESAGIPITGFASPFGKWNPFLNQVLEEMKFAYSSEFAMGYDDLPFFPVFNNTISSVLQIPVHPICIGSLRDMLYPKDEMIEYFDRLIKMKFERNSPIMLYGHPRNEIDRFPEVTDFILSSMKNLPGIWLTTYTGFAEWWKKRLMADYSIHIDNESITINTDNTDERLQLRIERRDFTEAYLPLLPSVNPFSDINWLKKEHRKSAPTIEIETLSPPYSGNLKKHLISYFRQRKIRTY